MSIVPDCDKADERVPAADLIFGDRPQVQQLLLNIISNALEAFDNAGIRRIDVRSFPVSHVGRNHRLG